MYIWLRNIILISAAVVVALLILIFRDKIGKVLIKINGLMKIVGRKVSTLLDSAFTNFRKMNISLSFYIGTILIVSFCLFVYGFNNKDDKTRYLDVQLKGRFQLVDVCEEIMKKEKINNIFINPSNEYSYRYNGVFTFKNINMEFISENVNVYRGYVFIYAKGNKVYGMRVKSYGESDDYTNTVKFEITIIEDVFDFDTYIDYQRNKELIERAFNLRTFYPSYSDPFSYLNQKSISMKISNIKDVEIEEDTLIGITRKHDNALNYLVTINCFLEEYRETIKTNTRCIEIITNYPIHVNIPFIFKGDVYSFYLYEDITSAHDEHGFTMLDMIYEFY